MVLIAAGLVPSGGAAQSVSAALDRAVRARDPFGAVVYVQRGDSVLLREAYGFADYELGVPLAPEHLLRIGSVTKPFTAQAVLLLEEDGRLRLGDPLCDYVERCPEAWSPVTVRHLLGHTSGIPDLFGELDAVPVAETRGEVDRLLASGRDFGLRSPPGSTYAYSNFGYVLLGYVVEMASGSLWEDVLIERLFDPLGMGDTRYDDVWVLVPGRAHGYRTRGGGLGPIEYDDHAAYAAGGLRSSIDDMARWANALFDGRILSDRNLRASLEAGPGSYGLGWQVTRYFDRLVYNHTGAIDGFTSHVAKYPDDDLLVIVLANIEATDARATACDLAALLLGADHLPLPERVAVSPDPRNLARVEGTYAAHEGPEVVIRRDGNRLWYRRGEGAEIALRPIAGDLFVFDDAPDVLVRFGPDGPAPATSVDVGRCGSVLIEATR